MSSSVNSKISELYLSIYLSVDLSVYLTLGLTLNPIYLCICLSVCLSIYLTLERTRTIYLSFCRSNFSTRANPLSIYLFVAPEPDDSLWQLADVFFSQLKDIRAGAPVERLHGARTPHRSVDRSPTNRKRIKGGRDYIYIHTHTHTHTQIYIYI